MDKSWDLAFRKGGRINAHPTQLLGRFCCNLTTEECNEWHEHLEKSPLKARYFHAASMLRAEENAGNYDTHSVDAMSEVEEALYQLAKKWHEDVIKPREEEAKGEDSVIGAEKTVT